MVESFNLPAGCVDTRAAAFFIIRMVRAVPIAER
jgi:hypothetical protein